MGVCATTSETETRVRAPTFWSSGTSNGRRSRRNNRRYSDKVDAKLLKQKVDELGIKVPGVLGAWGYYHAGENRDLVGSGDEVRRKSIEYAKKSLDQASVFGAKFFEVCAGQPGIPQLPWPVEPIDPAFSIWCLTSRPSSGLERLYS